ncbi:hypothetical protein CA13_27030 [Planctomycetes bacterium CA13]|uniref:STAS/SEC14 domain-containing protein n=1 Tax=Novipirellula herctigrandis TaxID=2527986 RepID=A0A5C5Z1J0_9BACT|nr:hypothetical protein CA13_27030 [Planctomycetes bacterium CA13]
MMKQPHCESTWLEEIACFCRPFSWGKIEYFDHSQLDEAKAWLTESLSSNSPP